ncbi:MAG TPA: RNA 2',3'-cyclic phosphodiesterase [Candidatus Nanoarchaeia archaeon]|nr:RNA 2',3'-cyclic phosphodiesterase [Candidatus Nanoarchaeia archaeon]
MRCFIGININNYGGEFNKIDLPNKSGLSKAKEYHITLIFYKDLSETEVNILKKELSVFSFSKFKLEGDKLIAFPKNDKPELYALGFKDDSKLKALYEEIKKITKLETTEKFNPHITLIRKEVLSPNFKDSKEKYKDIKPIEINIESFGLYKSEPNKGMNSYTPIFTVKLK